MHNVERAPGPKTICPALFYVQDDEAFGYMNDFQDILPTSKEMPL